MAPGMRWRLRVAGGQPEREVVVLGAVEGAAVVAATGAQRGTSPASTSRGGSRRGSSAPPARRPRRRCGRAPRAAGAVFMVSSVTSASAPRPTPWVCTAIRSRLRPGRVMSPIGVSFRGGRPSRPRGRTPRCRAPTRVTTPSETIRIGMSRICLSCASRSRVGLSPTSPLTEAGIRIEPPPSLACAIGTAPAATSAAEPAELAPGDVVGVPRGADRRRGGGARRRR